MSVRTLSTVCLALTIGLFIACKKDNNEPDNAIARNSEPIAQAGTDQIVTLTQCHGDSGTTVLDGSSSTDPDGNLKTYTWRKISGKTGVRLRNPTSVKAELTHLSIGEYVYELTVQDEKLLLSKDSIKITVRGVAKEYDLDVTFDMPYTFTDDYEGCGWDWPDYPCPHDLIYSDGGGTFAPLGKLRIITTEHTDAANTSHLVYGNSMSIYLTNNEGSLHGTFNVNIKRLISQGGGSFSGELRIQSASAQTCNPDVLANLPPLYMTGTLDPAIKMMRTRLKGKVYF